MELPQNCETTNHNGEISQSLVASCKSVYLPINAMRFREYLLLSGMVKTPLCIASVLSLNGKVKKHSL